jgi:hypothetical protein
VLYKKLFFFLDKKVSKQNTYQNSVTVLKTNVAMSDNKKMKSKAAE